MDKVVALKNVKNDQKKKKNGWEIVKKGVKNE